jgi:phage-related protein (TIGR01555 family)
VTLPYQQMLTENDWGMSVVERIFDRLLAFDSATTGAAQLVYKAHLRTYSINDLRKILGMGGPALSALMKHMDMIRQYQSIEGMTLMDATDKFESHTYSFSGLSDVIAQFGEQVSGALGIPLVRLFGQSPAGFSTGDADLANYYDGVGTQQERRLRRPVHKLASIIHMSELGKPIPDDFAFEFNPLWQMSETDRSTVASNTVTALSGAVDSGIMTAYAAAQQLRDSSRVTGIGSTISDEDIESVKDIDPPLPETSRAAETETGGEPVPKPVTKDSARGGRRDQWFLRWFK